MKTAEWVELGLIGATVAGLWSFASALPETSDPGRMTLTAAGALLGQSLLRDLFYLYRNRGDASSEKQAAKCMCLESTVGLAGIVLGIVLLLTMAGQSVGIGATGWAWLVGGALVAGFLSKDYVLTWMPIRLRKDPDHMNIIVKWW